MITHFQPQKVNKKEKLSGNCPLFLKSIEADRHDQDKPFDDHLSIVADIE